MEKTVLGSADIARSLKRLAFEIMEKNQGLEDVVLLGIPTRGVELANRLGTFLKENNPCLLYTSPSPRD